MVLKIEQGTKGLVSLVYAQPAYTEFSKSMCVCVCVYGWLLGEDYVMFVHTKRMTVFPIITSTSSLPFWASTPQLFSHLLFLHTIIVPYLASLTEFSSFLLVPNIMTVAFPSIFIFFFFFFLHTLLSFPHLLLISLSLSFPSLSLSHNFSLSLPNFISGYYKHN